MTVGLALNRHREGSKYLPQSIAMGLDIPPRQTDPVGSLPGHPNLKCRHFFTGAGPFQEGIHHKTHLSMKLHIRVILLR